MSKKINEYLNQLLADTEQLLCLTRQVHWYMRGPRFNSLHPMLDEYIAEFNDNIDDIAEMLITLGGAPYTTLSEYAENTQLELTIGNYNLSIDEQIAKLIDGMNYYDELLSRGIDLAEDANNQPFENMVVDQQAWIEKHIWMLSAEIGDRSSVDQQ